MAVEGNDVLPLGWESAVDPKFKQIYYFNRSAKVRTWTLPTGDACTGGTTIAAGRKPAAWEPRVTESGEKYFFDRANGEVSWEQPERSEVCDGRAITSASSSAVVHSSIHIAQSSAASSVATANAAGIPHVSTSIARDAAKEAPPAAARAEHRPSSVKSPTTSVASVGRSADFLSSWLKPGVPGAAGAGDRDCVFTGWEIEIDGAWSHCDKTTVSAVHAAEIEGKAEFRARGFEYAVDLESCRKRGLQRNVSTGKCRKIRKVEVAEMKSADEVRPTNESERVASGATIATPTGNSGVALAGCVAEAAAPAHAGKTEPAGLAAGAEPARTVTPGAGNEQISEIFEEMAAVMKVKRDRFRALAYDKAAVALRGHPEAIVSGSQAKAIEGIGAGMARRIDIVLETGELEELRELRSDPDVIAIREIRSVHGIGPKRAGELIERGVRSLAQLRAAVASGTAHLDATQTLGLRHAEEFMVKIPRVEMVEHEALLTRVAASHPGLQLLICGSYRRGRPQSGDIDALITLPAFTTAAREANAGGKIIRGFVQSLRDAAYVTGDLAAGSTKYMGVCRLDGAGRRHRRLDIRCVPADQYHFATLYFTGCAALSVRLRLKAIELGMTLNEYGCASKTTDKSVSATSEKDIFDALGIEYLLPTQRG